MDQICVKLIFILSGTICFSLSESHRQKEDCSNIFCVCPQGVQNVEVTRRCPTCRCVTPTQCPPLTCPNQNCVEKRDPRSGCPVCACPTSCPAIHCNKAKHCAARRTSGAGGCPTCICKRMRPYRRCPRCARKKVCRIDSKHYKGRCRILAM